MHRRQFLQGLTGLGLASTVAKSKSGAPKNGNAAARQTVSTKSLAPGNIPGTPFRIGVESTMPGEGWWGTIYGRFLGAAFDEQIWIRSLKELGAEFTLFYDSISPRRPPACKPITDMCRRQGMDFLFNNTYGDIYGPWLPDCGRAEYSDVDLEYASKAKEFRGIILDEVSHRQVHSMDVGKDPYISPVKGMSLQECYDRLLADSTSIVERYRQYNGATVGEYVFPILSHVFARAGIVPAPKFCSLSYPPVYFGITAGAAKQYDTEFWVVHDFWGAEPFWGGIGISAPGFSPEMFRSNLLLAYWLGADAAYTEALHNMIQLTRFTEDERRVMDEHKMSHRGYGMSEWLADRKYILNAYGKIHRWFAKHYVPAHPRDYTFRDVKPRVAMIRFPDSVWNTHDSPGLIPCKAMYGPGGLQAQYRHYAWFDAWHLLTHGTVTRHGLSIYAKKAGRDYAKERNSRTKESRSNDPIDYPYNERYIFTPVDGVMVFDHLVGEEHIRDAELIILTGEMVSEETSQAVCRVVEAGADCLSLAHLAPVKVRRADAKCPYEVTAGKGRFLVVDDFMCEASQRFIRKHLGPHDRICYRFGDRSVSIREGEGYMSHLINDADIPA